jgi:hypothetical protein
MILKPLKEVHPTINWNDPQMKSSKLGYCATEYYSITKYIAANYRSSPYVYTLVANMHLSLELVVKAIAIKLKPEFKPKDFRHKTSKVIVRYADEINEFKSIHMNKKKMELIQELENGFIDMRYGETYCVIDHHNDLLLYNSLFIELIDFLYSITKVKFLTNHLDISRT